MHRFDRDTAVERLGEGRFRGQLDEAWWIKRGPNGGYLAAIMLRAMQHSLSDAARTPRSLTAYFVRPPAVGGVELETCLEREGSRVTVATVRMLQQGKLCSLATGAFGTAVNDYAFQDVSMPEVEPPERCPDHHRTVPIDERVQTRVAYGAAFSASQRASCGGWVRAEQPRALDAPLLTLFADAWFPAVFTRATERLAGVPTIDLTLHFHTALPLAGARDDDYYFVCFESGAAQDGYVQESGRIFHHNGTLLATTYQHALVLPR